MRNVMFQTIDTKRVFDILISSVGLIVAAPLMLVVAIIVKLGSPGPVFYSARRVGKDWKLFDMLKFRTMLANAEVVDCRLCPNGDVRVTPFGQFLRRTKLNELPQLFNVFRGDMSAVGPRPEDPKFTLHYKEAWDVVLSTRPGIVGPNQIVNRNEDDLLASSDDPEGYYIESILPPKLKRDIDYVKHHSLTTDLLILFQAVYVTLFRGYSSQHVAFKAHALQLVILDTALAILAYLLANVFRFETIPPGSYVGRSLLIVGITSPLTFLAMGLYKRSIRFFSVPDVLLIMRICIVSAIVLVGTSYFFLIGSGHSRAVYLLYPMILLLALSGPRMLVRILNEREELQSQGVQEEVKTIIYGAGRAGTEMFRRLRFRPHVRVLGFVDDDEGLKGKRVLGVDVLGSGNDLPFLKSLYNIQQFVIAFESQGLAAVEQAEKRCRDAGLQQMYAPRIEGLTTRSNPPTGPQLVRFVEELGVKPVSLNVQEVQTLVEGSTIAIVGAGDAFGEQLCLQLIDLHVSLLIVIEDCESRLARITNFLGAHSRNGFSYKPYLCPVGASALVEEDFRSDSVKWIVYRRPNRPMMANVANKPAVAAFYLHDAAQFLDLGRRLKCTGFSLISPTAKDYFSAEEREFHLFTEKYIKHSASASEDTLLCGIVRFANIIEAELALFATAFTQSGKQDTSSNTSQVLHFTTAKNAATLFLNSLPMHARGGRTFMGNATVEWDLTTLVELWSQFQGNDHTSEHPAPMEFMQNGHRRTRNLSVEEAEEDQDLLILPDDGEEDAELFARQLERMLRKLDMGGRWAPQLVVPR